MKITAFDRATCKQLSKDLQAHIEAFARERGISITPSGGTFDPPMKFTMRLKFEVTETVDGKSAVQAEFEKYANLVGLTPEHFGRTVTLRNVPYTIVGLHVGRKRPVLVARADGKKFQIDAEVARRAS